MATIAAPIIDWSGGTPPQAQGVLVDLDTVNATANVHMTNVNPAPQLNTGGDGGTVGYSTG